jgi:hypothetical protein
MWFEVVTKVPDPLTNDGNLYSAGLELYLSNPHQHPDERGSKRLLDALAESGRQDAFGFVMALRAPCFTLGEILILDGSGREVCGRGRKPSKWFIETEGFGTIEEAAARAIEITDAAARAIEITDAEHARAIDALNRRGA